MKLLSVFVCVLWISTPVASAANAFSPGCAIPFNAIKTTGLDIDKQCGINGGSDEHAKKAESAAKNNFCAPEPAKAITYSTFTKLGLRPPEDLVKTIFM